MNRAQPPYRITWSDHPPIPSLVISDVVSPDARARIKAHLLDAVDRFAGKVLTPGVLDSFDAHVADLVEKDVEAGRLFFDNGQWRKR